MKRIIACFAVALMLCSCSRDNNPAIKNLSIDHIVKVVSESAPAELGYSDVSKYYLISQFSKLQNLKDLKVFTCNDSLNFNEFGVFEFASVEDAEKGIKKIKEYLYTAKKEFEKGIIYDTEEYPKFQNAKAKVFGNFVFYGILDKDNIKKAISTIEELVQKRDNYEVNSK